MGVSAIRLFTAAALCASLAHGASAEDPAAQPAQGGVSTRAALLALSEKGDHRAILERTGEALRADPGDVTAWEFRAFAYQRLGQLDAARNAYVELLTRSPDNVWALTQLGSLRADAGQPAAAIELLERALALDPKSLDARRKLVRVLREEGRLLDAAVQLSEALLQGEAPAVAHAELGYLSWLAASHDDARAEWKLARESGADEDACARAVSLVLFDQRTEPVEAGELQAFRQRRLSGPDWTLRFDEVTVLTRVGPTLPERAEDILRTTRTRVDALIGGGDQTLSRVIVHLARSREEHEASRRRLFPQGARDKAFMVPRDMAPQRPRSPGGRRESVAEIHVCWFPVGFETGLSHELAHSVLRDRLKAVPSWLDEGVATYAEIPPGARPGGEFGALRPDLLATWNEAALRDGPPSLMRLLSASFADFVGRDARPRYAAAWSLVHYLVHGREQGLDGFRRLISAQRKHPMNGLAAFQEVYGRDLTGIEADWRRYVARISK